MKKYLFKDYQPLGKTRSIRKRMVIPYYIHSLKMILSNEYHFTRFKTHITK